MKRTSPWIGAGLIAFTLGSSTAFAQGSIAVAQQNACRPDVFRLCGNFIPDVGEIVACLRGNESRLSEACDHVMFSEHAQNKYAMPLARTASDEEDLDQQ